MQIPHDSRAPFGPRLPANFLADKIRMVAGGRAADGKASLFSAALVPRPASKVQSSVDRSAADDTVVGTTPHPETTATDEAAPIAASGTEGWGDGPERGETPYMVFEQAHSAAREADVAMAEASDAVDRSSHAFVAAAAKFVEQFDRAPFETDQPALDAFLDEQGVAPLHGNAATPLLRVMQAFKTKQTKAALVGKRATALAGLRAAKVPADQVGEALGKAAATGRKGGLGHYINVYRKSRRTASAAATESHVKETQAVSQFEPEAARSGEPVIDATARALMPADAPWIREIEERIAQGDLFVSVDDRVLSVVWIEAMGSKLTLHTGSPSGG